MPAADSMTKRERREAAGAHIEFLAALGRVTIEHAEPFGFIVSLAYCGQREEFQSGGLLEALRLAVRAPRQQEDFAQAHAKTGRWSGGV